MKGVDEKLQGMDIRIPPVSILVNTRGLIVKDS